MEFNNKPLGFYLYSFSIKPTNSPNYTYTVSQDYIVESVVESALSTMNEYPEALSVINAIKLKGTNNDEA
jgi:hypothetical protein